VNYSRRGPALTGTGPERGHGHRQWWC